MRKRVFEAEHKMYKDSLQKDLKVNTIYSRKPGEMLPRSGFSKAKVTDRETIWEEFLIKWFDKT